MFIEHDTDKRVFPPAYPLFWSDNNFYVILSYPLRYTDAQVPEPEAGLV